MKDEPGYWRKCHDIAEATNVALRAQIERLSAELAGMKHVANSWHEKWIANSRELAALRAQLEAAQKQEPVYQVLALINTTYAWLDCSKEKYDFYCESPELRVSVRMLYAAPIPQADMKDTEGMPYGTFGNGY